MSNLEETNANKFNVAQDFIFRIEQLGISLNWPEMDEKKQVSMMDVFVFLQKVKVIDQIKRDTAVQADSKEIKIPFRNLFEYDDIIS